jgi:Secretion system C-terminal sorting domain
MKILLNDGLGGTVPVLSLTTLNTAIVTNLGATATDGTGIYGMTHTANRELVFLYDNTAATGRPLTSTYIEDDGTTGTTFYPSFYQTNVDAVTKTWGTFIPNTLASGVRRIQYMNATGSNVYAVTSTDGVWPGAVSTINPAGGTTALLIDRIATGTSGDFIVDSAVVLATPVLVNNSFTLNNGIVTSTAVNLLSIPAAGSTTGASNTSFVFGPVKKTGNTPFTFPVGKANGYLPIRVSNFTGASAPTDEFTAEYIRASGAALGAVTAFGIAKVSSCEYWNLDVNAGTPTVDLTLYWNANNPCNGAYITSVPDVEIAHFGAGSWNMGSVGMSSIGGGSNNAAGNVTWAGVNTFSPFTIASRSAANPLPIIINYITGTKSGSNHLLNWRVTCVSVPSATIELERSTDGRSYSSIYSIFATALRCEQPFNYTDAQPAKGINYYRLKMTDSDGKITYSTIVPLINAVKGINVMNIAPNPVINSSFNLKVSAAANTKMEIVITDMQGRLLQKQVVNLIAGFNTIPMTVRNLAAGTYQLAVNTEGEKTRVLRFVIQ